MRWAKAVSGIHQFVESVGEAIRTTIDVHHHYYPQKYLEFLERSDISPHPSAPLSTETMEDRIARMDQESIKAAILSASQAQPYLAQKTRAADGAKMANDLFIDVAAQYRERFKVFAALPLPHIDLCLAEIERVLDHPDVVGITVTCTILTEPLDHPRFEPMWQELNRKKSVVFLHPAGREDLEWLHDYHLTWMVGAPFEDTVAALRLAMSGMTQKYRDIRFIVPHLGGTLPFLLARLLRQSKDATLAGELATLFYDTVSGSVDALTAATHVFGADHLLFGTDYPYCTGEEFHHHQTYLSEAGFSTNELAAILGKTSSALLDKR